MEIVKMKLVMSLFRYENGNTKLPQNFHLGHHALYVSSGSLSYNDKVFQTGDALYVEGTREGKLTFDTASIVLHFCLHRQSDHIPEPAAIMQNMFEMEDGPILLRLDQVSFPIGAQAFRHIHHGAGIRYLKDGTIKIISDHASQIFEQDQAWFEDFASPVEAIPQNETFASFIRAMAVPEKFEGQTTIEYLNDADKDRPKFQKTHRFFDKAIAF